jgi:hypothetical protein
VTSRNFGTDPVVQSIIIVNNVGGRSRQTNRISTKRWLLTDLHHPTYTVSHSFEISRRIHVVEINYWLIADVGRSKANLPTGVGTVDDDMSADSDRLVPLAAALGSLGEGRVHVDNHVVAIGRIGRA